MKVKVRERTKIVDEEGKQVGAVLKIFGEIERQRKSGRALSVDQDPRSPIDAETTPCFNFLFFNSKTSEEGDR